MIFCRRRWRKNTLRSIEPILSQILFPCTAYIRKREQSFSPQRTASPTSLGITSAQEQNLKLIMAGKRSRSRAKDASSGKRSQPHTRRPRKKPKTDTLSMPASKILSMGTVKSAVSSLLKDAEVYERKRAKRAEAKGKVVGELMTDESFVNIMITFREPPFKGKLRPCAM